MLKKTISIIYAVIFIISLLLPVFSMPFWGESSSAEKRELQAFPEIYSTETGFNKEFTSEISDYVSEHFSFRSRFVTLWSLISADFFNTSTMDNVIMGKDGWLFFGDTIPDYLRTNVFNENQLYGAVKTLDLMNEYVSANGGKFLFVVAPNKNTVYPQYMPAFQKTGTNSSNYKLLTSCLSDKEYYLNVLPLFMKRSEQLYHKKDSHWNNLGASICYSAITEKLGKASEDYESSGYSVKKDWSGDLDLMLFPTRNNLDEQIHFNKEYQFEYVSSFHSEDDIKIKTYNSDGNGNLIMYRDSFTNALQPMLSSTFENAYFTRILPCRLSENDIESGDTVILELAERNIPEIISSAPVMQAPLRDETSICKVSDVVCYQENVMDLTHVYGYFERPCSQTDIYVTVDNGDNNYIYEAFPVMENELLSQQGITDIPSNAVGFSAYIPLSEINNFEIGYIKNGD